MSQPPVNTAQLSPTPNYSTSIPVVEVSDQPAIPAHQPAPYPPLMVANPLASQPQWLNDWSVAGQADADHSSSSSLSSSSSTSSSQGSSSGVVLVSRQTTGPSPSALCLESLPPEAHWSIFTQLQQPRLFNTSLSNLAKTSTTMHENAVAFLKSSPNGRRHKTMHQWTENIRFIHENYSDKKFKLNSKCILKLANEERVGSFIETLAFKPKTICFDFSSGQHWEFLMEALGEMTNTVIKIDASGIGMAGLIAEIVPAIANASESNMLILDLSSNALSAGNALDLLKQIDKHNNVYQLNLSDNPDFANNPAETKEFFNFLFGKIRPLSHLRLDNTGFNDSCAQSFGSAIQNPHLLKVINFANHTASSEQTTSLKKSIQKRTAEIRYFQISKTEIYSTLAAGMFDANTDVDWDALEQDYKDAQEELSKNIQQGYFSEVARRVRNHPIPRLLNQSHYEFHSDDDEVEFDHSLLTD